MNKLSMDHHDRVVRDYLRQRYDREIARASTEDEKMEIFARYSLGYMCYLMKKHKPMMIDSASEPPAKSPDSTDVKEELDLRNSERFGGRKIDEEEDEP